MYNKLAPQIKLPYSRIKGSFAQRQQQSIQMVDKLYRNIVPKFDQKGEISIEDARKSILEVLGKKINVLIKSLKDSEFDGGSDIIYSPISENITGTTIELPETNGKIKFLDLVTLLHEFQHVTDQIFLPKYLSRNQHMHLNNKFTAKYQELYDCYIYAREYPESKADKKHIIKDLEYRIRKFLRNKSTSEKIDYIQDTRYTLIMERQAYLTQRKYAKKLNKQHKPINKWDLKDEVNAHMLNEKIALLEKLGFEIIEKFRSKHACKIKKRNLRNVKQTTLNSN